MALPLEQLSFQTIDVRSSTIPPLLGFPWLHPAWLQFLGYGGLFSAPWHFHFIDLHFSRARNETCSSKGPIYSLTLHRSMEFQVGEFLQVILDATWEQFHHIKGVSLLVLPHVLEGWEGGLKWGRNRG